MTRTVERISRILQGRSDFVSGEICSGEKAVFIRARFDLLGGSFARELIVDPMVSDAGKILRVCDLQAGSVPSGTDGLRFCEFLTNSELLVGRLIYVQSQQYSIWYIAHQFFHGPSPSIRVLNRLIDEALKASFLCTTSAQIIAEEQQKKPHVEQKLMISPSAILN